MSFNQGLSEARARWKPHGKGQQKWLTLSKPWGHYLVRSLGDPDGDSVRWAVVFTSTGKGPKGTGRSGCIDGAGKVTGKSSDHPDRGKAKKAAEKHIEAARKSK